MIFYRKWSMLLILAAFGLVLPVLGIGADEGAKIFTETCSPCHSARVRPLDKIQKTREQWKETVDRMIDQGAEVPKGKKEILIDYLATTHGLATAPTDSLKK